MRRRLSAGILVAGAVAGIGDTLLAVGMYHVSPIRIYQSVASGLLGREAAIGGGLATAGLGMLLHFFIATTAAAVFFTASARLRWLVEQAVACGLAFGVAVYFFMKQVVRPQARGSPRGWSSRL